jgi:PhnB protein
MKVSTYLNFNGNTEEVFNFYKSVFGNEFISFQRFKEGPEAEKLSKEEKNLVLHVALPICDTHILMGTDAPESMGFNLVKGNTMYISLAVDNREQADELFGKLSVGGEIEMPLEDVFWGGYFGMFTDKFGVKWMISYESK